MHSYSSAYTAFISFLKRMLRRNFSPLSHLVSIFCSNWNFFTAYICFLLSELRSAKNKLSLDLLDSCTVEELFLQNLPYKSCQNFIFGITCFSHLGTSKGWSKKIMIKILIWFLFHLIKNIWNFCCDYFWSISLACNFVKKIHQDCDNFLLQPTRSRQLQLLIFYIIT